MQQPNLFTEANLKRDHHFKLHLNSQEPDVAPVNKTPTVSKPTENHEDSEKRGLKAILKDGTRQIVASFVILVVGFLALNWPAISQNIVYQWNEYFGIEQQSPLKALTETKSVVYDQGSLKTSSDLNVAKKQIPQLNMELAPADDRIIIPRINQNTPIVKVSSDSLIKRDWNALEKDMQKALQNGVVHYPGTSLPGQTGNTVITGHSSYFPWDPGRFKDVFALLHEVKISDKLVIYYEQDKFLYEVTDIKVVLPEDVDVLKQTPGNQLTLITCTPIGTNLKRLIVTAKEIAKNDKPR